MKELAERFEVVWSLLNRDLNTGMDRKRNSSLTHRQWSVLSFIWTHSFVTAGQIAEFTNVGKSSATAMINRLEKLCYVQRKYELDDRRIISLEVTTAGYEALARYSLERRRIMESYLNKLAPKSQIQLINLLEELYGGL